MVHSICLFALGLFLVMLGGDRLVDAAVALSRRMGLPQLVIGATVVSIGTTLPEILVSCTAAIGGNGDLAAGNAIGSIICNTALVGAMALVLRPPRRVPCESLLWRAELFFAAFAVFLLFARRGGVTRSGGIVLLAMFAAFALLNALLPGSENPPESGKDALPFLLLTLAIAAVGLAVGARLIVNHGIVLAKLLGVPQRVIAVTMVALGTSLPELATTINGLRKNAEDVALGNILGANILNLLLVIGIPAAWCGVTISPALRSTDSAVALVAMAIYVLPMLLTRRAHRWQGIVLLLLYAAYGVTAFVTA